MVYELVIVGAGPAGLSAAIEAAKAGVEVAVVDENTKAGGQLFKQVHKFFGGKEHRAGRRGIDIGTTLLKEAEDSGVHIILNTAVWGIFNNKVLGLYKNQSDIQRVEAQKIIIATGASENSLAFPGWTLPGVLGAGAAQTMVNMHRVSIGERVLMVGSGNVGLIVSYQLIQSGIRVVAVIEALPHIGGYGVHASKVTRLGVPILTSHTIVEAQGDGKVESAVIAEVDSRFQPILGTKSVLTVDAICIAVGLTPLTELLWICGCDFSYMPELGGWVPVYDDDMETTIPGVYVAGDVCGIEEASTAMIGGAIAGLAVANSLGYLSKEKYEELKQDKIDSVKAFRSGRFESRNLAREKFANEERRVRQWLKG